MAVVEVKQLYGKRTGGRELPNVRKFTEVWQVLTDTAADRASLVLAASGLPKVGYIHVDDPGCFVRSAVAACVDEVGTKWEVTVEYSNDPVAANPDAAIENPVERRTRFIPSFVPVEEIVDVDINGNAVRNSAGGQFADPVYETRMRRRLTFIRNEADLPAVEAFVGKVNSKKWFGYAPGEVKLVSADPSELTYEGEYAFYVVTYVFDVRKNTKDKDGNTIAGWARSILDSGMRRIFTSGGVTFSWPIYMGDPPLPVTEPINLDGEGQPLDDQTAQHFLTFETAEYADFNKLNLSLAT